MFQWSGDQIVRICWHTLMVKSIRQQTSTKVYLWKSRYKDQHIVSVNSYLCHIITYSVGHLIINQILYCIHFYSASHSMSLSEALPTTAIDTVLEFTRRSATGNCK